MSKEDLTTITISRKCRELIGDAAHHDESISDYLEQLVKADLDKKRG